MGKHWLSWVLGLSLSVSVAHALDVPDRTIVVVQRPIATGIELEVVEMNPSKRTLRVLLKTDLGQVAGATPTVYQSAVVAVPNSTQDPSVFVLSSGGRLSLLTSLGPADYLKDYVVAIAENDSRSILAATSGGEVLSLDPYGASSKLLGAATLGPHWGTIASLQWITASQLLVQTNTHLLQVQMGPNPHIVWVESFQSMGISGSPMSMVADASFAWLKVYTGSTMGAYTPVRIDLNTKKVDWQGSSYPDFEMLDVRDHPGMSHALIASMSEHYVSSSGGGFSVESVSAFSPSRLVASPQGVKRVHVNHEKSSLKAWAPRVAASAPSPRPQGVTAVNPKAFAPTVAEPSSAAEFRALLNHELGVKTSDQGQLSVEEFCARLNTRGSVRYYFQTLTAEELKDFGLRKQMYWIVPLSARGQAKISLSELAEALAQGVAREIAQKACGPALTPKP